MDLSHIPDLGSRQLLAVLAIADYGSFIAAAAFLKTSQPALTRTIKRIEDVLGVSLFDRTTRRVQLTAAGREFVAVADRVLNDLRISVRSMRELADQQRGQVIVAAIESVATGVLPRIIAEYHIARPAIELRVREGVHGAVLEDIRSGVADLGITFVDELPNTIAMVPLGPEVFHAVMPRQHRLAPSRGVTMKQIAHEPLVSLTSDVSTRRIIDAAASKQGTTFQHAVTVTQLANGDELRAGRTGSGHRSRGRHRGLQYRRAQDAADHRADIVAQPRTYHAEGTRANPRGHRHLDADPLGLVDRSGLIRLKQ
jgi:DNA-binding transcriptional LysR family regulator